MSKIDYEKAWRQTGKHAHKIELELNTAEQAYANECAANVYLQEEIKQLKVSFDAELNAAKNDYARYKQLEAENTALKREIEELVSYVDALVTDCDNIRTFLHTHGIEDAFSPSRKLFNKLPDGLRKRLIDLQVDALLTAEEP